MSRKHPKPFFRTGRGWYVQLGKEQIKLAPGPRNYATEDQAWSRYHEIMAKPASRNASPAPGGMIAAEVFEKYLDWCKKHRAARTYDWYRDHIQDFINFKPEIARLAVAELRPFHVIEWADSHAEAWSNSYRRGGIVAIQRPFNWAEELGYIEASPIKRIKKPQPDRRDNAIIPEVFIEMLSYYPEPDPFRDLLLFAWHSGCRPQEARHLEPRHVVIEQQLIFIPKEEAKGKRRPRIIHLQGPALDIITRLLEERDDGKLFLNEDGVPWKRHAIAKRFERLAEKIGKRYALYDCRHGFTQKLLENGANHLTVAELLGHANGNMVSTVYSHMNRATTHLKETLRKAGDG